MTALVPSDTACLASSPGRMRRTAVWISRDVTVGCALGHTSQQGAITIPSDIPSKMLASGTVAVVESSVFPIMALWLQLCKIPHNNTF